jgi:hypothetical protein
MPVDNGPNRESPHRERAAVAGAQAAAALPLGCTSAV